MGGTSGGPQALPTPPASDGGGAPADASAAGPADVDDGGLYGDPIGPGSAPADLPAPLPPSFLTDGVGLGQPNLPDDVFLSSSLMAENGILDAPTVVSTPEYLGGLKTAQEMLGTKPDGFALRGGETDLAALQGARDGAVKLPGAFKPPTGLGAPLPNPPTGPSVTRAVSTPGRSMAQQVATVRKMKAEEESAKPPTAKPTGPRLSGPMDLVAKAPAPKIAASKIDPIKAASELRHIATFKAGRFERNEVGTPTLQGQPLDTAKAKLMERALKARDANDLDAFDAALKRHDNSLTGPEQDFLRGVAENRFENTSDAEFDALTAEGVQMMGGESKGISGGLSEQKQANILIDQVADAVGEVRRDIKEGALRAGAWGAGKIGLDTTSKYLKHFLDGSGKDIEVPRDEARQDPFIRDSEEQNRKRFENGTFLGKTENAELNDKLLSLKDGQAVNLADHWEVDLPDSKRNPLYTATETARRALGHPDRFLATGSLEMISSSGVVARRHGDTIQIEGTVLHKADDRYDFADNDDSMGAYELQESGRGMPFTVRQNWRQKVKGTVKILGTDDNGKLLLGQPRFQWEDMDQAKPN